MMIPAAGAIAAGRAGVFVALVVCVVAAVACAAAAVVAGVLGAVNTADGKSIVCTGAGEGELVPPLVVVAGFEGGTLVGKSTDPVVLSVGSTIV